MTDGCHLFQGSVRCPGRVTCWSARWRCWCCASAWASARRDTSPTRIRTRIPCAFDNRGTPSRYMPTPRRRRPRSPSSRSVDRARLLRARALRTWIGEPPSAKLDARTCAIARTNSTRCGISRALRHAWVAYSSRVHVYMCIFQAGRQRKFFRTV